MKYIKNFFRNIIILLFRIDFVIVTIKDHNINIGKTPNTQIYKGKDHYIKVQVPLAKIINFRREQFIKEYIVLDIDGHSVIFDVVTLDYIYDLMTGKIIEIIIYSTLQ